MRSCEFIATLQLLHGTAALISVGYERSTSNNGANTLNLADALLNPERPHIQVVDVNDRSIVSTSPDGSELSDHV